ncbi:hypothetical protein EZV62_008143 [Acer yangbiense]|uniref:RING-type E3 ubiquitin transferase n=1 Tax=Acer yangbiense TaxID=1000413 RepID=A0A5C7ICV5_9ROSI|nr:hypothetical protein EZV62_008143 [Acer yangbiense]
MDFETPNPMSSTFMSNFALEKLIYDTSNLNFFEKSELSNAEHVYTSIGFYLEQHGLCGSDREEIQQQISSFARSISWNSGRAFIPIYIEVGIFVVQQLQVQSALEKLRLRRDGDDVQMCAICQEEFLVGIEVTSLPCSHIYHGDCIVKWLRTSHCCPLCRFKMTSTCS